MYLPVKSKRSNADKERGAAGKSTEDLLAALALIPCPQAAAFSVFSQLKLFEPIYTDTPTPAKVQTQQEVHKENFAPWYQHDKGANNWCRVRRPRFEYWP